MFQNPVFAILASLYIIFLGELTHSHIFIFQKDSQTSLFLTIPSSRPMLPIYLTNTFMCMSQRYLKQSNLKHNSAFTQSKAADILLVTGLYTIATFYSTAQAMAKALVGLMRQEGRTQEASSSHKKTDRWSRALSSAQQRKVREPMVLTASDTADDFYMTPGMTSELLVHSARKKKCRKKSH